MARQGSLARVESIERQQAELKKRMATAKRFAKERKKEEESRRAAVLGAAIIAFYRDDPGLGEMIRRVVPGHVKAKVDLQLFDEWITPAQIAAGEGEVNKLVEGSATEPG